VHDAKCRWTVSRAARIAAAFHTVLSNEVCSLVHNLPDVMRRDDNTDRLGLRVDHIQLRCGKRRLHLSHRDNGLRPIARHARPEPDWTSTRTQNVCSFKLWQQHVATDVSSVLGPARWHLEKLDRRSPASAISACQTGCDASGRYEIESIVYCSVGAHFGMLWRGGSCS
jgi:hypothetical protein